MGASKMYDAATQADYAEEPLDAPSGYVPEGHCACGYALDDADRCTRPGPCAHRASTGEARCERCGASPAYLFDHTPLAEEGTWERLCNACMDTLLEPWQGDGCDCPHTPDDACACDEHCAEYGVCEGY